MCHQLVEEQDKVGNFCFGSLAWVGRLVVGRLGVKEFEKEALECGRASDKVSRILLPLLLLSIIWAEQISLSLFQQLCGNKGSVLPAALAGDGPLAEDEHNRFVLSAYALSCLWLTP